MLSCNQSEVLPSWQALPRSGSPSKQRADQTSVQQRRSAAAYALVLFFLGAALLVFSQGRNDSAFQQALHAQQAKLSKQAESLAASIDEAYSCRANSNRTLAFSLQQCNFKAQQKYDLLESHCSAIKAAASSTLADFRALQQELESTKAALAVLQHQHEMLANSLLQDKYRLISPQQPTASNNDSGHQQLLLLADQVATKAVAQPDGSISSREIIVVLCDADTTYHDDIISPWCQSAQIAGLTNILVLADDVTCIYKAQQAGLQSLLLNNNEVPASGGAFAGQNAYAFHKYTALKVLLTKGFSVLAAEPDMMLVSDPYKTMQQGMSIDMVVASDALDDDSLAYGRDELHEDPLSHELHHRVHVAGLSPSLMHLKPNKACLEFVDAMLQGLNLGQSDEQFLLDQLLLTPSHAVSISHTNPAVSTGDGATLLEQSRHDIGTEQTTVLQLAAAPRIRIFPIDKFTSSAAVFGAERRDEWLSRHTPSAIHVMHDEDAATRMRAIVARYKGQPADLEALHPIWDGHGLRIGSRSPTSGLFHPVESLLERLGWE